MFVIEMCVVDNVLENVILKKNAKDMRNRLEKIYIRKSMSKRLIIKKQLFKLEMKEGHDLNKHINLFKVLVHNLKRIDVILEEED